MMGVGNVTELTEADTSGINAVLFGIAAELRVAAVLTTEVSGHARRAVREADAARRMMFAARESASLAKGLSDELMTVHAQAALPGHARRDRRDRRRGARPELPRADLAAGPARL